MSNSQAALKVLKSKLVRDCMTQEPEREDNQVSTVLNPSAQYTLALPMGNKTVESSTNNCMYCKNKTRNPEAKVFLVCSSGRDSFYKR